jgi:hypothetical protein
MAKRITQGAMATGLVMMMLFAVAIGLAHGQVRVIAPLHQHGCLHDRHA